ncbi:MAG: hypothetical protein A3B89_03755 [Candidatus Buchananbacteria bacterium RIFCSPHIGHO2_02_FULL_40_13]|uniref:Uncharacterized protein n=1 Tax=Candidatus Buchananbacteria bacterium RIFCSPLOWO2_01_FULL_39_33 TaxID=1797543 RepID=A0A1G1YHJ7_9BACT|nr:MAG: hypothetical protein A2820_01255 [Candidatus Buchananbacteria bacterium RIFCSPHIGHO2_01_FULL_40_35]OGY48988.1 MAG: hypothetical protein A3B89_03755 [Candidatus Buchananbacteria bacterium RIFCSPHIGHO2_02_FULL_40_13]OGY51838.1 MAG: hypothetical protein A3A02_03620 [Candidatus Buchananbacteria bacterium RIFCSPLOWO2_01_FULL_39_33]
MSKKRWTDQEIIKAIEAVEQWQKNEHLHPLTCRSNSQHPPLVAWPVEGMVVLACTECSYIQEIPQVVLIANEPS